MRTLYILILFISLSSFGQSSKSTLVLFNNRQLGPLNFVTILKIDERNKVVLHGRFKYLISLKENELKNIKSNNFDSLNSLLKLIDTSHYDTFTYSRGKIILANTQYAYYKNLKINKLRIIKYDYLSSKIFEELFYGNCKYITRYYFSIPFDLYDFDKNKFRKIQNDKKFNWSIIKNQPGYKNLGYRYQFINYVLPFFSPYSFDGERESGYFYKYEIGKFYESYKYIEKVFLGE